MYIKRNHQGQIIGIRDTQTEEFNELASDDDPEYIKFLKCEACKSSIAQSTLEKSDTEFVRVLEDVIELLINKNIIQFTDLPPAAREKLSKRQNLRESHRSLKLFSEQDDDDTLKFL